MEKKYFILRIITIICVSLLGITGTKTFANEIGSYNLQEEISGYFKWVSKPGDHSEDFKIGDSMKVPIHYLDKYGRKEIDIIFYDKNGKPLDMTKYKVTAFSDVVGPSTTSTEYKKKGHLNLPIRGVGETPVYLSDSTSTVKVTHIDIISNPTITSASGLPMNYNTSYYIFNDKLKGKRGGLTFEPYANADRLLYSNSVSGKGTSMIFQKKSDTASKSEIKWGDAVTVKSTSSNWGNSSLWSVNTLSSITLSSSPSTFYISNGRNVSNLKDTNSFGLSAVSAEMMFTGDFLFYLKSLNPLSDFDNKEWLKATGNYHFATNWQGEKDKLQAGLQMSQQDNIRAYESDYKNDFEGLIISNDKICYTISKRYYNSKIRYVLRINGNYLSEAYDGSAYYSQSKENSVSNIEITTNVNVKKGDKITLDVVTNEAGYPSGQSTILQTLSSTVY